MSPDSILKNSRQSKYSTFNYVRFIEKSDTSCVNSCYLENMSVDVQLVSPEWQTYGQSS